MNVQNVSSCLLQQFKNYLNRVCFSRVVITNVQLTFLSHPVGLVMDSLMIDPKASILLGEVKKCVVKSQAYCFIL